MTRIAFCAALYEAGRPYLPAFLAGIRAAARGHDACLLAAVDDLIDPAAALGELEGDLPVSLARCPAGSSPALVRRTLLTAAVQSGADVLIFADMDDMLLANAPGNHLEALEDADFSYGDLCLMDVRGNDQRQRFFDKADIPWAIAGPDVVRDRNFLGLSNTAVRTSRLPASALQVPDDIVAVDWWLFTSLLLAGRTGRRTVAPVTSYRLYESNTLGAGSPATPQALRRTLGIMQRHYRAFRAAPGMASRLATVDAKIVRLSVMDDACVAFALAARRGRGMVWYDGLVDLELEMAPATAGLASGSAVG